MKSLGIIGGLGPMASAYFLELITKMTDAECDQEHLQAILYSYPTIPDRTAYILQKSTQSPVPEMVRLAKCLEQQSVGAIAIPCITAHYFFREIQSQVNVPLLNAISATAEHLKENGVGSIGIMATDGTIATGLMQDVLKKSGMTVMVPEVKEQNGVMDLIYRDIKANKTPDIGLFRAISNKLRDKGAEVILLGCTELSLFKKEYSIGPGYIDALDALARVSVLTCGARIKEEYRCLITG